MTFISSEIKTQRTFLMRKALKCRKISKKNFEQEILKKKNLFTRWNIHMELPCRIYPK